MDSQEIGKCGTCGKEGVVMRAYYNYDLWCDCHIGNTGGHFDTVFHCFGCLPVQPRMTTVEMGGNKIILETKSLKLI